MKTKLSIVYDMTKKCPWNCPICCMGASSGNDALYGELSYVEKHELVEQLRGVNKFRDVHIDFSGGEIFTDMDNVDIIEHAAEILGRDKIGISSSGYMISNTTAERLSHCIHDLEMTMDTAPGIPYDLRPTGYAIAAAKAVPILKKYGIEVGIQTVLARSNSTREILSPLYDWLCRNGVDNWSMLKFYPSGRGAGFAGEMLNEKQEQDVIRLIYEMDKANNSVHKPVIDFHYTMKGHPKYNRECRCVKRSIGIMPNGDVTSCFWAVDSETGITDPKFLLGNVRRQPLAEIITNDKAKYWTLCTHECELKSA